MGVAPRDAWYVWCCGLSCTLRLSAAALAAGGGVGGGGIVCGDGVCVPIVEPMWRRFVSVQLAEILTHATRHLGCLGYCSWLVGGLGGSLTRSLARRARRIAHLLVGGGLGGQEERGGHRAVFTALTAQHDVRHSQLRSPRRVRQQRRGAHAAVLAAACWQWRRCRSCARALWERGAGRARGTRRGSRACGRGRAGSMHHQRARGLVPCDRARA